MNKLKITTLDEFFSLYRMFRTAEQMRDALLAVNAQINKEYVGKLIDGTPRTNFCVTFPDGRYALFAHRTFLGDLHFECTTHPVDPLTSDHPLAYRAK
jgi:hypothetical protein